MKYIYETERLLFRKYTLDDVDELLKIIGDADNMKYYPKPYDKNGCVRWINWNLDNYDKYGFGLYVLILKETNEFVGDCGITIQNINGRQVKELGFHIAKKFHRLGFATEASKEILNNIFIHNKEDDIYCYQSKDNIPSRKTALKLGFEFLEEYVYEDVIHSVYIYKNPNK